MILTDTLQFLCTKQRAWSRVVRVCTHKVILGTSCKKSSLTGEVSVGAAYQEEDEQGEEKD